MKLAVTYDNGEIFQHFGHTEQFKVYEIEDGRVVSSEVVGSDGAGHEALAGMLAQHTIEVLICGGIGGGAMAALSEAGITVCAGVQGSADEAVEAWLRNELESTDSPNCDHHHGEGHQCGGSCGGCSGGCGSGIEGRNVGKTCKVHYRGTFNNGEQFDSSYDRGQTLDFVCGAGMMIRGFDAAVADMEVGQSVDIHLMPEEAYGEADPRAIFTMEIANLPGSEELSAGERVYLYNSMGQPVPVKVVAKDETTITFDANHEMAGKELNFHIELIAVED